jgi:hypothetical protein
MTEWKWLIMNGCECSSLISGALEFLNLCQDVTDASVCLGIVLKNNDI